MALRHLHAIHDIRAAVSGRVRVTVDYRLDCFDFGGKRDRFRDFPEKERAIVAHSSCTRSGREQPSNLKNAVNADVAGV